MTTTPHQFPMAPLIPSSMLPGDNTGFGYALNLATKAIAGFICLWPGETIAALSVCSYSNKTGSDTQYVLGVEGISNNAPDGTYKESGNAKTVNTLSMAALDSGTRVWSNLGTPHQNVGSAPEFLALTMRAGASAYGASNYGTPLVCQLQAQLTANWIPYSGYFDGSSWSYSDGRPAIAARDANGLLVGQSTNAKAYANIAYNNGSGSPQIRGVKWTVQEFTRLAGVMLVGRPAASADFKVYVYLTPAGGSQSLVSTSTFTKSVAIGGVSNVGSLMLPLPVQLLAPGDVVRIVYEPQTSTSMTSWSSSTFASAAELSTYLRQVSGASPFLHYTTAVNKSGADAGTWTDDTAKLPSFIPCVDQRQVRPMLFRSL